MVRLAIAACVVSVTACGAAAEGDPSTDTDVATSTSSGSGSESVGSEGSGSETQFSASVSETTPVTSGTDPGEGSSGSATTDAVDCAAIEAESAHCLTIDGPRAHLVGLDSGSVCTRVELDGAFGPTSLAWTGDEVVGCDEADLRLRSVDLATGTITSYDTTCQAVAVHPEGLVVLRTTTGSPELYGSVEAIASGRPAEVFAIQPTASRIATANEVLYSSWHQTQAIQVWDLATSTYVQDVVLEDWDDWVFGLAVVGGRLVVLGPAQERMVRQYDVGSGALLGELPLPDLDLPQGLACR